MNQRRHRPDQAQPGSTAAYAFSDWDPDRAPAVPRSVAINRALIGLAGSGRRVLLAGPHDDNLVTALLGSGAELTYLVRAAGDARRLADQWPTPTVLCGSPGTLDPAHPFDTVIAASGLDRLTSVEGEQPQWIDLVRALTEVLAADGVFAFAQPNPLSLHELVQLDPTRRYDMDAAWSGTDSTAPATMDQVAEALGAVGLRVAADYTCFAEPGRPQLLVSRPLVGATRSPLRGAVRALTAQAYTAAVRAEPVLTDPRPVIARAIEAGVEERYAAGWLVLASRGFADVTRGDALIVGETGGRGYAVRVESGVPTSEVFVGAEPVTRAGIRRVTAAPEVAGWRGDLVETRLAAASARADVAAFRATLSRFVTWLMGHTHDGVISGPVAFATPATVLDDGTDLHLLAPRWEPVTAVPVDVVITRALWTLAVPMVTGPTPHPWRMLSSAHDFTTMLLGMVDRGAREADYLAAIDLHVAWETAEEGLDPPASQHRRRELLAIGPGSVPVDVRGYAQLADALWRQRYQLSHLLAKLAWTESMIRSRDRAVSMMDFEIQLARRTLFGKLVTLARQTYRVARRDLKKLRAQVRRWRQRRAAAKTWAPAPVEETLDGAVVAAATTAAAPGVTAGGPMRTSG